MSEQTFLANKLDLHFSEAHMDLQTKYLSQSCFVQFKFIHT